MGIHHIRTDLYAIPLSKLRLLQGECLDMASVNQFSSEYRLISIILDIAYHRLDKPKQDNTDNSDKRSFLKLKFANKGIDAIHLSNILHHKNVQAHIPKYFKNATTPIISYSYTKPIASKIFNYKKALRNLNAHDIISNPPPCSCSTSPYLYSPAGHIITGNLDIIDNNILRDSISKGPKYRESPSFTWKYNFKLVMDAIEDYARTWAKQEDVEIDTLSEWLKSIRTLVKRDYMYSVQP